MNYSENFHRLAAEFIPGKDKTFSGNGITVRFFDFISKSGFETNTESGILNDTIPENIRFNYPVFFPDSSGVTRNAILLLHGLNERSWNKYLTWAEYLCKHTGKAVILFPLAFHINRSPAWWCNPRNLVQLMELRKQKNGHDRSLSFANVALSERISANPGRFYSSGQQSVNDLTDLLTDIYAGNHSSFTKNTKVDVFAYSIGAFLAQILFMINPNDLLGRSKLFLFCGGSVFSRMYGTSRSIMDKNAYERLYNFYTTDFYSHSNTTDKSGGLLNAFSSMLDVKNNTTDRIGFFRNLKNRFRCVALAQDRVIPFEGIREAIGEENLTNTELLDFGYSYNHENPFPLFTNSLKNDVNAAFERIFSNATAFLA